ncbi:acyl-homoserine-lactone synthase [Rhizobium aegyptiacum]|uniref:acyl-homoserine-lactone synthase n=1 Tax=Rhizobium TaxID=379 RepID=UPI001FD88532|nr:acyl-homoserine-lactone synthase [Rhizobium aegyptiacum]
MIRLYVGRHESRGQAMEKIWRFRHEQFVERLGWEALCRNDGLEIDQFDHDRALHLALFFEDTVVGYTRLLPTTEPHLLSDVYPQIMKGQAWPRSPEIVPIQAKPSMSGLRKHHQLYSIQGNTLLLEPEVRNPLKPDATLHQVKPALTSGPGHLQVHCHKQRRSC